MVDKKKERIDNNENNNNKDNKKRNKVKLFLCCLGVGLLLITTSCTYQIEKMKNNEVDEVTEILKEEYKTNNIIEEPKIVEKIVKKEKEVIKENIVKLPKEIVVVEEEKVDVIKESYIVNKVDILEIEEVEKEEKVIAKLSLNIESKKNGNKYDVLVSGYTNSNENVIYLYENQVLKKVNVNNGYYEMNFKYVVNDNKVIDFIIVDGNKSASEFLVLNYDK